MKKAVTIVSGGMDSATIAYQAKHLGFEQRFLSFNYGQRHVKELIAARRIAGALEGEHDIIDLTDVGVALKSNLLAGQEQVPDGHYAEETMRQTVVPNRNAIMLSIAWGVACSIGADAVFFGAHAGDHYIYPDCRQVFIDALTTALRTATEGLNQPELSIAAPFIHLSKAEILTVGLKLQVPFNDTWTCYKGGEKACGRCGSCVERLQAFALNHANDPLEYEDREYWKAAIDQFNSNKAEMAGG